MFSSHVPKGTLVVTVVRGQNLNNKDFMGSNDPYVELWLNDKYKQRTSTIKDNNNPEWNETFNFSINQGDRHHKLHLKVLDQDKIGSDKIGETSVDVSSVLNGGPPLNEWVKLPKLLGLMSDGQIHLCIQFHHQ